MTYYSIKAYRSEEDFDNRQFLSLFGPEFESLAAARAEARLWLSIYPILKVESDDLEEIEIMRRRVK